MRITCDVEGPTRLEATGGLIRYLLTSIKVSDIDELRNGREQLTLDFHKECRIAHVNRGQRLERVRNIVGPHG